MESLKKAMSQNQMVSNDSTLIPSDYKRILVGYDGSKNAERALSRAIYLAKEHKAALQIVVVMNVSVPVFSVITAAIPQSVIDTMIQDSKDVLAKAIERAKQVLGDVTGVLRDGHAAEEILGVAAENRNDLIVVGRRGISSVQRFLLGGVSSTIVDHSKCDVLVVE